ncbi:hypothetical protein [Vibrio owensii]|uniref:hypothetical protein n=1 Tax=Vibrio owensii TaxID=696485 RepID=UPI0018F1301B|nr:hypothetical protein [Vibrio owensii]
MKLPFDSQKILEVINGELEKAGSRLKAMSYTHYEHDKLLVKSNRGGTMLVMLYMPHESVVAIRAIHSIVRKNQPFAFMFNGQPTRNLKALVLNFEDGEFHYASKDDYCNHLRLHLSDRLSENDKTQYITRRVESLARYNPNFA